MTCDLPELSFGEVARRVVQSKILLDDSAAPPIAQNLNISVIIKRNCFKSANCQRIP